MLFISPMYDYKTGVYIFLFAPPPAPGQKYELLRGWEKKWLQWFREPTMYEVSGLIKYFFIITLIGDELCSLPRLLLAEETKGNTRSHTSRPSFFIT